MTKETNEGIPLLHLSLRLLYWTCVLWGSAAFKYRFRPDYRNFILANEQEGSVEIGYVTKAFYRKISHRKHPTPNHIKLSNLDDPFCGIHPAFTQLLLAHRLDYFRDFNSRPEHTYCTLTPVKWGWLLLQFISLPSPSSGVVLYCCWTAQIFFFSLCSSRV